MLGIIDSPEALSEAMRISRLGDWSLVAGLLLAIVAFVLTGYGMARRDERFVHAARRCQYLVMLAGGIGCAILLYMLFDGLYVSGYVYRVSELQEEAFFKFTGLWASQEGSLLFWCFVLSICGATFAFTSRHTRTDRRLPATLLTLFAVEIFFFGLMMWESSSPFTLQIAWLNNPDFAGMTIDQFIEHFDKVRSIKGVPEWTNDFIFALKGARFDGAGNIIHSHRNEAQALAEYIAGVPGFEKTTAQLVREKLEVMPQYSLWEVFDDIRKNAGEAAFAPIAKLDTYANYLVATQAKSLTLGEVHSQLIEGGSKLPSGCWSLLQSICADGKGLNPQLHNYWIAIHPPTLYFGYIGFTIPFCLGVGSLISGELGTEWIRRARLWTMTAWTFLTAGIAMGGLWAYEILGWGGYWAWDPVENASFIPWLTATAFIHSVVVSERRGMLRTWNVVLIILTYCLTIVGTFLVRSGIVQSVHAFGETGLKIPLLIFMGVILFGSLLLVVWRQPMLRAERRMESVASREGVFLLNNLVLLLIAFITLTMTLWPALTEYFGGDANKQTFGEQAYTLVNAPLFMLLLVLTAIGPLLAWGRSPVRELVRQMAWPAGFGAAALAVNVIWVRAGGHQLSIPEDGDFVDRGVQMVRVAIQYTLMPVLTFLVAGIGQELVQAARQRRASLHRGWIISAGSAVMANRRRFGGYIAHIGMALVAAGIYFSSVYETDTSAQLPTGGYTLVGRGDNKWAVVNDIFEPSPLYRDLQIQSPSMQKVLFAARQMRVNPTITEAELKQAVRERMPFSESMERSVKPESLDIVRNTYRQLQSQPSLTPEELVRRVSDAPQFRDNPQAMAPMVSRVTAIHSWLTLNDADLTQARRLAASSRSFEDYTATVRLFRYTPKPLTTAESEAFLKIYGDAVQPRLALEATKDEIQRLSASIESDSAALRESSDDAMRKSAEERLGQAEFQLERLSEQVLPLKQGADEAVKPLIQAMYPYGPDIIGPLNDIERVRKGNAAAFTRFHEDLRAALFAKEREVVASQLRIIVDSASTQPAKDAAEKLLDGLGFRALGGLRIAEAARASDPGLADAAAPRIAAILAKCDTVRPRIQTFFDKLTGQPRSSGEQVRDPEIISHLSEDVYLILQGVDLPEAGDPSKDIAIFRVFVKPGMVLGIAGLVVIVLGALFALLPKRQRLAAPVYRM